MDQQGILHEYTSMYSCNIYIQSLLIEKTRSDCNTPFDRDVDIRKKGFSFGQWLSRNEPIK